MRVFITGGTGLIGRALSDSLVKDGHEVLVLTRKPEKVKGLLPAVHLLKWDGRTPAGWGDLLTADSAIINLAGAGIADGRWSAARKRKLLDSRVNAGNAVSQAIQLAAQKPAVLLQSSAIGYYGVHKDELITESSPAGADFLAEICKEWEASTAGVADMTRRVVLRTGVVLSTFGGAFPKMTFPFQLFVGGPVGAGKQYLSWIHIEDQVRAIRWLLENAQAQGVYNLTAPEPVTNARFGGVVGRLLGKPAFLPAPAFAMKALFGEMSTVLLDGQRVIPQRLLGEGFQFRFPTINAALEDLFAESPKELLAREAAFDLGGTTKPLRPEVKRKSASAPVKSAASSAAVPAKKAATDSAGKRAKVHARRLMTKLTRKGLPVPPEIIAAASAKLAPAPVPAVVAQASAPAAEPVAAVATSAAKTTAGANASADDKRAAAAARRAEALAKKKSGG